jgi:hypothetical protein
VFFCQKRQQTWMLIAVFRRRALRVHRDGNLFSSLLRRPASSSAQLCCSWPYCEVASGARMSRPF